MSDTLLKTIQRIINEGYVIHFEEGPTGDTLMLRITYDDIEDDRVHSIAYQIPNNTLNDAVLPTELVRSQVEKAYKQLDMTT